MNFIFFLAIVRLIILVLFDFNHYLIYFEKMTDQKMSYILKYRILLISNIIHYDQIFWVYSDCEIAVKDIQDQIIHRFADAWGMWTKLCARLFSNLLQIKANFTFAWNIEKFLQGHSMIVMIIFSPVGAPDQLFSIAVKW